MSVTGKSVKTKTSTKTVGSKTTTTITVEETYTYSDGKTELKTREMTVEGPPPSKEQIKAFVDAGDVDDEAMKKLSISDVPNAQNKGSRPTPTTTSSEPTPIVPPGEYAKQAVKAHNEFRSKHGVPDLTLASDLSTKAQKWADHLLATNTTGHSPKADRDNIGENIAYMMGTSKDLDYDAAAATASWYSEIKEYGSYYGKEPPPFGSVPAYGHFTQVVWNGTKEMGIGKARGNGKVIVVANYRPAGNMIGSYSKNVFKPK